jgi:hypothetical protein
MSFSIFLIFNKVNLEIALGRAIRLPTISIMICDRSRIGHESESLSRSDKLLFWNLNRFTLLAVIVLIYFFKRYIHLYSPHFNNGTLIRLASSIADNIHLIDDGLDTYRERPLSNQSQLRNKAKTVSYLDLSLPVSSWIETIPHSYGVSPVIYSRTRSSIADIESILILSRYSDVVVESPDIPEFFFSETLHSTCIIEHPNPQKRRINKKSFHIALPLECSLEDCVLALHNSSIHIGYTYSLVLLISMLIRFGTRRPILNIYLTNEHYKQLACLHKYFSIHNLFIQK